MARSVFRCAGLSALLVMGVCISLSEAASTNVITYQGELQLNGTPVNNTGDVHFTLYDDPYTGTAVSDVWAYGVSFVDGRFTVGLDFGSGVFNGRPLWAEIQVAVPQGGHEVTLSERQPITATPYALYALNGGSGGDSPWETMTGGIYYNSGNVAIGTTSAGSSLNVVDPGTHAIRGECVGEGTVGYVGGEYAGIQGEAHNGVYGVCTTDNGYSVYGYADTLTGTARGIFGEVRSADGVAIYGTNRSDSTTAIAVLGKTGDELGFGGYFEGKGYFSNRVGIGTDQPSAMLDVNGRAKMATIQVGESATAGHVLTANASGEGSWQAIPAGTEPVWETDGTNAWYTTGNVGIGTSSPYYPLEVSSGGTYTGFFSNSQATGTSYGVYSLASGTSGRAVYGTASATSGTTYGVYGRSASSSGRGVYGYNSAGGYGVYGYSTGWAGYFSGNGYISGDVGIGTTSPTEKLDVNGTVRMNGFQLDGGVASGFVLTSDSSGVGTWQPPTGSGFSLPYSGTVSSTSAAFQVTNTGSGISSHGIVAKLDNASSNSDAAAGFFNANNSNGMAIYATSDGTTIKAHSGSSTGTAIYGYSSGNGGYFSGSGTNCYGVKATAGAMSGLDTYGGWFETNSSNGSGVYSYVDGDYAMAVKAVAEGGEGIGVYAEAPWNAIYAKSPYIAGKFYGDVRIYEYGTTNQVFHVDASEGTTSVDVLHITGGSDLAENFDVVDSQAEPGTVVEIDPENPGKLRIAQGQYNRRVAGVVSGANGVDVGMVLSDLPGSSNSQPVALSGRVWVKCDASAHAVKPGDMLTTSDVPGHAMPVMDYDRAHGAVIGKAMSKLAKGETGMVLVLVNLQ